MPYIANKQNLAQLTNIHYWDSGAAAWSGNLIGAATPFAFLPNPTLAGDLVLFGIDSTILNSGPFCSLVFDIGQAITGVTSIIWRYSDVGGADPNGWAVQLMQDNTDDDGLMTSVAFNTVGINSVHWIQDALWVVQNPTIGGVALGVTGLWICADITTVPGAATPPTQQNRDIYTINWAHLEVARNTIEGDLDSLLRVQIRNQSDVDTGATAPDLGTNDVIVGLRSVDRGDNFVAYLNASDVQQPPWITVGTLYAFANSVRSPTGRVLDCTPAAGALLQTITWDIDGDYAPSFYGTFHAFTRVYQYSVGAINTIGICLAIGSGGGTLWTGSPTYVSSVAAFSVVDLGRVTIPGTIIPPDDVMDYLRIEIDTFGDAVETLYIYDLILIPVDEWAGHFYRVGRELGARGSLNSAVLDIDNISYPKRQPRPTLRHAFNNMVWVSEWGYIGHVPAVLKQGDQAQRLWWFCYNQNTRGYFEVANSIYNCEYVDRFSSMRGAR